MLSVLPHLEAHPLLRGEGQAHDAAVPSHVPARDRWCQEAHGECSNPPRFSCRGEVIAAVAAREGRGLRVM